MPSFSELQEIFDLYGSTCVICGSWDNEPFYLGFKNKDGVMRVPLCPECKRKFLDGRTLKKELKYVRITPEQYERYLQNKEARTASRTSSRTASRTSSRTAARTPARSASRSSGSTSSRSAKPTKKSDPLSSFLNSTAKSDRAFFEAFEKQQKKNRKDDENFFRRFM